MAYDDDDDVSLTPFGVFLVVLGVFAGLALFGGIIYCYCCKSDKGGGGSSYGGGGSYVGESVGGGGSSDGGGGGRIPSLNKAARDNRANQLNPNNDRYWSSRGY